MIRKLNLLDKYVIIIDYLSVCFKINQSRKNKEKTFLLLVHTTSLIQLSIWKNSSSILITYFIYLENPKIIIKCVATEAYPGFFHQGQIQVLVGGAEIFSSGAESRPKG